MIITLHDVLEWNRLEVTLTHQRRFRSRNNLVTDCSSTTWTFCARPVVPVVVSFFGVHLFGKDANMSWSGKRSINNIDFLNQDSSVYVDKAKCFLHSELAEIELANRRARENGGKRAKRRKTTETDDTTCYCLTPVGVLNVKQQFFSLHICDIGCVCVWLWLWL